MRRHTFIVHVYPGGTSMLENLSTGEHVRVSSLAVIGPQIERWLAGVTSDVNGASTTSEDS